MRVRTTHNQSPALSAWYKAARRTAKYHAADFVGRRIKPLKLRLALTDRCNAKCIMCNIWKLVDNTAPSLPEEVTVAEIDRMLRVNERFFGKLRHVSLTGGEPTLRRDLVELIATFTRHLPDISMSFNTNGFSTRKTLEMVEQIMKVRRKMTVMVSIDGVGKGHDVVRGVKNVYRHCIATVDGLVDLRKRNKGLKLEINHCMTAVNYEECEKVYQLCRERNILFNPIYVITGQLYHNEGMDLELGAEGRSHLTRVIELMRRHDSSLWLREVIEQLQGKKRDFDCWAGRTQFFIEENADVFPNGGCPSSYKLGNLRDFGMDFDRLLDSPQAREALSGTRACRLCRLSCETMTTLSHPEALNGLRRAAEPLPEADDIHHEELRKKPSVMAGSA